MIIIQTAADLACVLASTLDPPVRAIIEGHRDRLAEYNDFAFEELAVIAIIQPGDDARSLHAASGIAFLDDPPEYLDRYDGWFEACFILSAEGCGWIVLIPDRGDTEMELLTYCRRQTANA